MQRATPFHRNTLAGLSGNGLNSVQVLCHSCWHRGVLLWDAAMSDNTGTGLVTKRRLRRGVFHGMVDLQAAINRYLAEHNLRPKPFRWKADANQIIAAAARGHQTLDSIH